ncbi:thermonuclease family protein [Sphingomonas sp. LT1P40]|uniref:thermonuclease family protein n=1 Tax=Alteristakelama amylovorans TaxID=3096166 RepID=UPI002FC5840F
MTFRFSFAIATTLRACAWASPALANPDRCEGALPRKGATFSGVVRYVDDGDGLCAARAGRPNRWIEIRLIDFYAPELHERGGRDAKRRLARAAMGKVLVCRVGRRSYDRLLAPCTFAGRSLGNVLRRTGGTEGGRGMR